MGNNQTKYTNEIIESFQELQYNNIDNRRILEWLDRYFPNKNKIKDKLSKYPIYSLSLKYNDPCTITFYFTFITSNISEYDIIAFKVSFDKIANLKSSSDRERLLTI
jgi:hypothetical protein